ncbi:MAG: NAD-dependent epimerase/dehydratase family protein [Chloroflexota bacterium]
MGSLITGIGYIGSRLAEMLLDSGEPVVGLDNLFSTDTTLIQRLCTRPGFTFVEGDVSDEQAVRRAFNAGIEIETVYHMAAQSSARPDAAPVRYTEETNLIGPRVVLEQACEAGVHTFVFGSSLQIYGRRVSGSVDENRAFGPLLDMNHLSKIYVEKLMEMFSINREIRCIAARIGLVYGKGPVMKADPRFMTAPNKFCWQAARGETLRVDASGFQPTSMVHLDDVCRGLLAMSRWSVPRFSALNLIGETASPAQVAEMVCRIGASRGLQVRLESTPPEKPVAGCSFQSALESTGFSPTKSLERDLPAVLDFYLNEGNPNIQHNIPIEEGKYSSEPIR